MSDPQRIYAIGDVHGQLEMLRAVHTRIEADLKDRPVDNHAILHIGDYTDRGPDSRGVIEYLIKLDADGEPIINLYGNHDRMFRLFLETPGGRDYKLRRDLSWLHDRLGGRTALASYGLDLPDEAQQSDGQEYHAAAVGAVPPSHLAFLQNLRDNFHWGDWFFAHAGVSPGLGLIMQDEDDLIWIRGPFLESKRNHGATIVHGHTPVDHVEDHGNRIAIDTGAGYGNAISCIVIEGASVRILDGAVLR